MNYSPAANVGGTEEKTMMTNDKGIVELKHQVLREVCRLAWEDDLNAESCE